MSGEPREGELGEVIFEITKIGDAQRVAAVHVESGVEVVIQAPASAALVDVRDLAMRKLQRALAGGPAPSPAAGRGELA